MESQYFGDDGLIEPSLVRLIKDGVPINSLSAQRSTQRNNAEGHITPSSNYL